MGLRETFQNAAKTAIDTFGNVRVSATYEALASTNSVVYNASSGTAVVTRSSVSGVQLIFDVFEIAQIDNQNVLPDDRKALIAGKTLSTITPKVADRIIVSGIVYEIVNFETDAADALYTFQLRRT
jgi:hypothetical protein